ncbi:MAG: hypothetical protein ACTSV7_04535 [Candidatus Baldrarchaeia archaeon]
MTQKEIEIQRALGTLPLWRRMELGDVKFIPIPLKYMGNPTSTRILYCKNLPDARYYYDSAELGVKARVMRRMIRDCRIAGWDDG